MSKVRKLHKSKASFKPTTYRDWCKQLGFKVIDTPADKFDAATIQGIPYNGSWVQLGIDLGWFQSHNHLANKIQGINHNWLIFDDVS